MTAAVTWDAHDLPTPSDLKIDFQYLGSARRMVSGAMRNDAIATKAVITMTWAALSETAAHGATTGLYDIWSGHYGSAKTLTGAALGGRSYSVVAVNGWRESAWTATGGSLYYDVTIVFTEV